jgi:hypothetical protein
MDNKNNRQFYWEVKDFINNNTPKTPEVKKPSLKDAISNVLSENKIYKTNSFVKDTDSNEIVSSFLQSLSATEKKNIPSIALHSKNSTLNPFNLTESKKVLAEDVAAEPATGEFFRDASEAAKAQFLKGAGIKQNTEALKRIRTLALPGLYPQEWLELQKKALETGKQIGTAVGTEVAKPVVPAVEAGKATLAGDIPTAASKSAESGLESAKLAAKGTLGAVALGLPFAAGYVAKKGAEALQDKVIKTVTGEEPSEETKQGLLYQEIPSIADWGAMDAVGAGLASAFTGQGVSRVVGSMLGGALEGGIAGALVPPTFETALAAGQAIKNAFVGDVPDPKELKNAVRIAGAAPKGHGYPAGSPERLAWEAAIKKQADETARQAALKRAGGDQAADEAKAKQEEEELKAAKKGMMQADPYWAVMGS